jgi:hypothetical protein
MTVCHCDGPPHNYTPSWCLQGRDDKGKEIRPDLKPIYPPHPWDKN